MRTRLKQIGWGALFGALIASQALGQTAALLPNAKQQFFSDIGAPLASGTVDFFVPSTNTRKTTWFSSVESTGTQNTNPVLLDAAGRAVIYGDGTYRQVLKDNLGNTIWDAVTASPGSGGGGSGAFTEGVMVGAIIAWTNPVLPAKYLYTAGQAISRTGFPDLFTAITYKQVIICSSGVSTITVSTTVSDSVPIGAPIEASCFAPGTTVASKSSGLLTMSSPATISASVNSVIFPWGNGDGSTTFNVPDLRGRTLVGRDNMTGSVAGRLTNTYYGSNPDAVNAQGGSQNTTLLNTNLPAYRPQGTVSITDPGHLHQLPNATSATSGINNNSGGGGGIFSAMAATQVTETEVNTTGITASFTGTIQSPNSTPISRVQPSLTADYIIKALADDLPSGPGVTSIQGMTGALSCGTGLTCTAQTISAPGAGAVTIGTTPVIGGSSGNIVYDNAGIAGEYALSTANQYNCATAGTIVQPSVVFQAETVTTYGTTTTFDFCTFKSTAVTLTGNITTQTLANVVAGKAGTITFIQDGTGSRTTVWNSIFKFTGGVTPTLTTTAGAVDMLTYSCRSATFCAASLLADIR